jgi:sec-independent protein translocase protein TatA
MFGSLGTGEIILIALVILILFGANKIPEFMRGLGRGVSEFKKASRDIQEELEKPVDDKKVAEKK